MSTSSNPFRDIVRQRQGGRSVSLSNAGLVINENYHVNDVVRPKATEKDRLFPAPGMLKNKANEGLKIKGIRTSSKKGWETPEAYGGSE